jgi:hypothetical protein
VVENETEPRTTKAVQVSPEYLASNPTLWEFVKQGCEAIKAKIGNRSKWTPMHVRQAVLNKGSELWVVIDETTQAPLGFYVLSVVNDIFINIPTTLFVWLTYATPGEWGLIERHFADVKERARVLGLENIEMLSPRKGWLKKLNKLGFEVVDIIHGCRV